MNASATNPRLGATAALAAFGVWGLAPIFFKWIVAVAPLEIIAHRVLWSVPLLALFLLLRDGPGFWRRMILPRRVIAGLAISGALVAGNWLLFVWAVNTGHILATSLAYFITPLINVLLGFLFLHERLSRLQTLAVLLAAAGTVYLAWYLGAAPWISLALAVSFSLYALARKKLGVGPMIGLLWETLLMAAPAVLYMVWAAGQGGIAFLNLSPRIDFLLGLCGIITVVPLIWFNIAARHLALSVVGFFQYLSPTITFLLAVFAYGESFTRGHAVAFTCIWAGLALVSVETLHRAHRARRA